MQISMYTNDHKCCLDMQNIYIYIDAVYFDTVKISIHTDTFVAVCTYSAYSLYIYTRTCNHTVDIYIYYTFCRYMTWGCKGTMH